MTRRPERTWTYDASHYPEPLTPLSGDVWLWALGLGMQAAARDLRAPFGGFDTMLHGDGWAYESELEADWEPDSAALERAALEVAERWERELMPRSHEITEEIRRLRPERGDAEAAAVAFDRLIELVREQWHVHFLTVVPVHAARELLHDAYVELRGKRDELEPYRLIEGLPNETLDADERLWEIAELARSLDVADVVSELPTDAALRRLATTHHGREVLAAVGEYQRLYGGRSRLHELSEPRAGERPELVLEGVRFFLEHPRDLPSERRAKARERAELEAEVLGEIADRGERERFAELLERVKAAVVLEETHTYHIDYPGLAATREALLGFGRRLVGEGRLERSDDVFMLRREELRQALATSPDEPLTGLVAERRTALERARLTHAEPFLGPAPGTDDLPPMVAKFYGVPGTATRDGDSLRGTPASAGEATGVARVVLGAEDFSRVHAGDVLVCATTTPAWTPLFSSIAALVTDTGGILSHAAIVAREYGLPVVVGAEAATRFVPDGALVSVNGASGEVRILQRP
ncbi:MAG TPA: PEP-utilizing enzyme [Thermoleophilaceae bacterium]